MTPQEVIKKFMARLANHGFSTAADDLGTDMFDAAVRASSRFSSAQEVIDAMKADQESAERAAVEEILGSEYAGKLMSDLDSDILSGKENSIKSRKAHIFLEKYCGIQLGKNFLFTSDGTLVSFSFGTASNVDTGAITGSDANITLKAGDTDFYGTELDLSALAESYGLTLEEDGSLIIGSGEEKTDRSIVDEISVNTYTASTDVAQKIYTGTRNWVVQATAADDTITAGGADSINAGAGDDSITVNGSGTTVTGGDGSDTIKISADVNDVTLTDFSDEDVMTISGSFEIGAAKIEDMMLVITDATGTRKLKLGDFTNLDGTVNVNGTKTSIGQWLSDSGINLADLSEENNQTYFDQWLGARMASDDEYQPTPIETPPAEIKLDEKPTENFSLNVTGSAPTVNLEKFTTLADGDKVSVDGAEVGSVSSTFPNAATFTRNGLTIHLLGERNSDGTIEAKTLDDLTDAQKAIVAGLFKWWAADCLNLDEKSLGISFNDPTAMIKDIGLYFYTDTSSEALAAVSNAQRSSADGVPVRLTLSVNMKYYDNISATDLDGDGVYNGSHAGLIDRTLTHEFVHALMGANVNFTNLLPQFITEGISELAHGIDDERASTIFRLAFDADELSSGLDLSPGTGTLNAYAGGFMFLRYFARQAALQTLLLPAYGDITADIDLSKFEIGDSLYCDDEGNVSTDASGIFLGKIVDDIEVGGTGGDAIYLVNDCGVKQIVHTAANDFQVGQITADVRYVGSTADDYAEVVEGACEINSGDGNDYFVVTGQYSSITAGDGSDTVRLGEGGHHSINLGDGDNFVRMEGKPLLGGDGSYTIARNYSNSITGGAGNDTLTNGNGVAAVDSIGNAYTAYEVFQGDDGNFYVSGYFDAAGVYVEENISVKPVQFFQFNYNHSFDLGDGDNQINLSYLTDTSILTGGGVDQIIVTHSDGGKIFSGAGNDLVSLGGGDGNSIVTGAGLDIVVLSNYSASNNSITTGDGSDYVLFGKLNDSLTAAGYIAHDENLIDLGAGNDSLDFAGSNNTITAGTGDDLLKEISGSAGGNHFIFSGSFGNDTLVGLMANDTIHLAEDNTYNLSENILTVKRGENVAGTIELQNAADLTQLNIVGARAENLNGFVADGADWSYYVNGELKFTVSGLSKQPTDDMLSGGVLTLSKDYFAGEVVTIAGDGYTLALGKNMAAPTTAEANYADGIYTSAGTTDGYTLSDDGKSITYSAATTKTFEFEGLDEDTTAKNFWLSGKTIKIGKAAVKLDGTPVKLLTEGYSLALGKNMAAPKNSAASYADGTFTTAGKTAGYNLSDDGKSIAYSAATTKTFEFEGLDDDTTAKNFWLSGKTIKIGKAAVKLDGTPVKLLTEGYTLALGKNMAAPKNSAASYADGIYTSAGKTAGYNLSDDGKSIAYSAATTKTFEFEGLDEDTTAKNFWLSGKTIKIGKAAVKLDGTPVKLLTEGYSLALGKNMAAPTTAEATYSDGIYTSAGTTDGYNLSDDGKSIAYSAATTKTFEFEGLDDDTTAKNFWLSGKTIKIGKAAVKLDGTPVKLLTEGYTLALGKGMTESEKVTRTYDVESKTFTSAGTTAGYSFGAGKKSVSYVEGTSKSFIFDGVSESAKATSFYYTGGNEVTVGKAAVKLDGTPVKLLTEGYTLKLGKGMTAPTDNAGTLSGGVYTFGGQTAGYNLSDDGQSITYTSATDPMLKLSGVASKLKAPADGVAVLETENFSKNLKIVSNAGGFTFSVEAGDYSGKVLAGSADDDFILSAGTNLKISAGAGNDTLAGGDGAETLVGGSGNDSIFGGAGNDKLYGQSGSDTLWGGAGDDTLTGGAGDDIFIYKPNEGKDYITDFTADDMLQILNADGSAGTFTNSSFKNSKLTLAIDGGGHVIFKGVTSSDTFNINGTVHTIAGSKLK